MGRHRNQRTGEAVEARGMRIPFTCWPESLVDGGRIRTADPWRCIQVNMRHQIKGARLSRALAFLDQAEDFHQAAVQHRTSSKPLLHYYSFLALAKAYIVYKKGLELTHCHHGLKDPGTNVRKRLNLKSQAVKANDARPNSKVVPVYREFVELCGFEVPAQPKPIKVLDLLDQAVGIAGVADRSMKKSPHFFPITEIDFQFDRSRKEAWVAFKVSKSRLAASSDAAAKLRENSRNFEEVSAGDERYRHYESRNTLKYQKSPLDVLDKLVKSVWQDIWSEMIPGEYRYWISTLPQKKRLSQLAAGYQAMFYLGSVTRYRPDDFRKIANGDHGWIVQEFLNTQPLQFIYFLGSEITGAEMSVPLLASY